MYRRESQTAVRLSEAKAPALIALGEKDIPDIHAIAGVLEANIPNAKRVVVPNADRLVNLDPADKFNQVIFNFLN
jgi:3-oxoadipate enol-lactonase